MVLLCRLSGLLVRSRASLQGTYNLGSIRALRTRSGKLPVSLVRAATSPTPAEADAAPAPAAPAPSPVEISSAPVEDTPPAPTFESLGLNSFIVGALKRQRMPAPTPIQAAVFPKVLAGKDVAIKSYTGSGKTLAYLLPVLHRIVETLEHNRTPDDDDYSRAAARVKRAGAMCLVVAPTADLAMQIVRSARSALPSEAHPLVQALIGGANFRRQVDAMKKSAPWIIVGTPGRLADMSRQGEISLHPIETLIIDEADQLLSAVYREDMQRLAEHTGRKSLQPSGRQTILVSATMTPASLRSALNSDWCKVDTEIVATVAMEARAKDAGKSGAVAKGAQWGWNAQEEKWSRESGDVTEGAAGGVATDDVVQAMPPGLTHLFMRVPAMHKVDRVRRALYAVKAEHALVFMNFQRRLQDTQDKLSARNMEVGGLHGDMSTLERKANLDRFRMGKLRALIVSDLAARGIDFPECDVVINLELPSSPSHYVHRAGRAGRAGREGVVITMVTPDQAFVVEKLAAALKTEFIEVEAREGSLVPIEDALQYRGEGEAEEEGEGEEGAEEREQEGRRRAPAAAAAARPRREKRPERVLTEEEESEDMEGEGDAEAPRERRPTKPYDKKGVKREAEEAAEQEALRAAARARGEGRGRGRGEGRGGRGRGEGYAGRGAGEDRPGRAERPPRTDRGGDRAERYSERVAPRERAPERSFERPEAQRTPWTERTDRAPREPWNERGEGGSFDRPDRPERSAVGGRGGGGRGRGSGRGGRGESRGGRGRGGRSSSRSDTRGGRGRGYGNEGVSWE